GRHRGRGQPHVPADGDPPRRELFDVRAADRPRPLLVELRGIDPPHVVRLEDLGVDHGRDAIRGYVRSYNSGMERKLATVLFVDLVGSTELISAADPEVVRRRVTRFFDDVTHCVTTHGGIVEKFAGDAVLAAFGVAQAHEDDAERAIRAGLGILQAVGELELQARVGIEAGEVVVDTTESTFATGEAVNLAARLQQAAAPGEILIGPAARSLALDTVETEQIDPVEVKGRGEPLPAWRVVCAADRAQPVRAAVAAP